MSKTLSQLRVRLSRALALAREGEWAELKQRLARKLERPGPPPSAAFNPEVYAAWCHKHDPLPPLPTLPSNAPLVSFLTVAGDQNLAPTYASLAAQRHPTWEWCIARVGKARIPNDPRVRVVSGTSWARAASFASGEWLAPLEAGDRVAPQAVDQLLLAIEPDTELIYTDLDSFDRQGRRCAPFLKPDWSPERFLAQPYALGLEVFRRSLYNAVGGFRSGRYDLFLRLGEHAARVVHLPQTLYHRRLGRGAPGELDARGREDEVRAIRRALKRRGVRATVEPGLYPGSHRVRPAIPKSAKVSILIPFRDRPALLARCLETLVEGTAFSRYELILLDNGSRDRATTRLLEKWRPRARVVPLPGPFNFAELNNRGAKLARGSHLLLLNNDTEIIEPDWLEALLEWGVQPDVGAVGARLLFPDRTVQHAGVLLGVEGLAAHAYLGLPDGDSGYFGGSAVVGNYSAVTGACLLVAKDKYEAVGGMNADAFRVAFNDLDLCLRLARTGWRTVYTPFAKLVHHESKSRGARTHLSEDRAFASRYAPRIACDPFYHPKLSRTASDFRLR